MTKPGGGKIGTGFGFCARALMGPASGTLKIPSTVAKAALRSVRVSRRIGVPSLGANAGNVLHLPVAAPATGEHNYRQLYLNLMPSISIYQRGSPENALFVKFCLYFVTVRNARCQHPSRSATKLPVRRRSSIFCAPGLQFHDVAAAGDHRQRSPPLPVMPYRPRGDRQPWAMQSRMRRLLHRHRTPADQLPDRAAWYRALASDPTTLPTYSPSRVFSLIETNGVKSASREQTG
jgi:hypothetical protein